MPIIPHSVYGGRKFDFIVEGAGRCVICGDAAGTYRDEDGDFCQVGSYCTTQEEWDFRGELPSVLGCGEWCPLCEKHAERRLRPAYYTFLCPTCRKERPA